MAEPLDRRHCAVALIFLLATAALWTTFYTTRRLVDRDAYDYAQIGRQIRRGHGYTTRQTFPRHIPYMTEHGFIEGEWPSLLRYPISPALNAFSQLFFTNPVTAAVVQTGVCFLLGVPIFFLLAARLIGARLASAATVFYVGDPRIWRDSCNGMTESLALLVVLTVFLVGLLPGIRAGRRSNWMLLGVLCGVAYLTRTQLVVLVPLGLVTTMVAVHRGARRRSSALFIGCFLIAVSPWLVRNYRITGDPLFAFTNSRNLLARTAHHTGIDRYLHEPVDVATVLARYHDEILDKVGRHVWPEVVNPSFWIEMLGVYAAVFPVFALAFLLRRRWPLDRRLFVVFERTVLFFVLANFFLVCLIYHRQRYYDTMIPLLIIVLVQRVGWLGGRIWPEAGPGVRRAALALLLVVASGRLLATLSDHRSFSGAQDLGSYEVLGNLIGEQEIIVSDFSAEIALFNGNRTVRTPALPGEILEIDDGYLPIDAVLISQRFLRPRYRSFIDSEAFLTRYELVARLSNEALLYRAVGE